MVLVKIDILEEEEFILASSAMGAKDKCLDLGTSVQPVSIMICVNPVNRKVSTRVTKWW